MNVVNGSELRERKDGYTIVKLVKREREREGETCEQIIDREWPKY